MVANKQMDKVKALGLAARKAFNSIDYLLSSESHERFTNLLSRGGDLTQDNVRFELRDRASAGEPVMAWLDLSIMSRDYRPMEDAATGDWYYEYYIKTTIKWAQFEGTADQAEERVNVISAAVTAYREVEEALKTFHIRELHESAAEHAESEKKRIHTGHCRTVREMCLELRKGMRVGSERYFPQKMFDGLPDGTYRFAVWDGNTEKKYDLAVRAAAAKALLTRMV